MFRFPSKCVPLYHRPFVSLLNLLHMRFTFVGSPITCHFTIKDQNLGDPHFPFSLPTWLNKLKFNNTKIKNFWTLKSFWKTLIHKLKCYFAIFIFVLLNFSLVMLVVWERKITLVFVYVFDFFTISHNTHKITNISQVNLFFQFLSLF